MKIRQSSWALACKAGVEMLYEELLSLLVSRGRAAI